MKANELRIGNYVHHNERNYLSSHLDSYLTVCELTEKSITTFYHSCHGGVQVVRNKKDYQPIPLTEEWLLRFGFLKADEWHFWINLQTHYFELMYSNLHWYPIIAQLPEMSIEEEQRVGLNAIYHVHQLQNLYFGLTGQELTIKEAAR